MGDPPVTSPGQPLCVLWPNQGDKRCGPEITMLIKRNGQKFHQISISFFSSLFLDHTQRSIVGVGKYQLERQRRNSEPCGIY